MNRKYIIGKILSFPLLPLLYFQGRLVRSRIPILPPAKTPFGLVTMDTNQVLNLLCLGESTMAGVGVDTHENGFCGALARHLSQHMDCQVSWSVLAKSGYTAKLVTHRLVPKMKSQHYDLIVIGLGANDAFRLHSPTKWGQDIRNLIEQIRKDHASSPIFFTNMPPIKEFPAFTTLMKWVIGNLVEILGEKLEQIVAEYDRVYYNKEKIKLATWSKELNDNSPKNFFSDGVHPSQLTYQLWAKEMAEFVTQNIQEKT